MAGKHKADPAPYQALPVLRPGAGFDLISGVRVLDLTNSVAGPVATLMLADMGAEVLKIERPGTGDDSRAWGPPFLDGESLWFLSVNRNKKSIALDYTKPEGHKVLLELAAKSDVVVVNVLPRAAAKLGIDAASLQAVKPGLTYVSITGFGMEGTRSDWACYDLIAEGYSGVMDLTGEPGSPPQKVGTPAADMLAGQDAAFATLAALIARGRDGKGRVIDIALVDSMTKFLACRIVPYLGSGEVPRRSGGKDSVIAIYQAFDTADDPITLGLGNDNVWRRFWEIVGEPDIAELPEYRSNADRRERRPEIVARIQAILKEKPRAHWLAQFRGGRVPAGPINRVDEVTADAEMQARGLIYQLLDGAREIPQIGTGFRIDRAANCPRSAPPRLGEHTEAVLGELLGYDDQTLAQLKRAAAI